MKFRLRGLRLLEITMAILVIMATPVSAKTTTTLTPQQRQIQITKQIDATQQDLEDATQQEIDTQNQLNDTIARQNQISVQVKGLDAQINAIQAQVLAAQSALDTAQAAFDSANAEYQTKQAAADASIQRVRDQAAEMMAGGASDDLVQADVLLNSESIQDLQRRKIVFEVVADRHKDVLDEAQVNKAAAKKAYDIAQGARDVAQQKRDVIAQSEAKLQEQRATLANLNAQAVKEAGQQARLLEQLSGEKVEYLSRIQELEHESTSISDLLKNRGDTGSAPAGLLGYPVDDPVVTSPFGPRVHPIYGDVRIHTGVDFRAATGTPVHAAADGEVVFSGSMSGYGNVIIIDHGGGMATLYAHNSVLYMSVGSKVKRYDVISLSGATGNVTGPHVHFEVRINGTPVDPMPYLIG